MQYRKAHDTDNVEIRAQLGTRILEVGVAITNLSTILPR